MQSDDVSARDPGTHSTSEGGRIPGHDADELAEATERLESAAWDPFEDTPIPKSSAGEDSMEHDAGPGPIRSFLEHQLQDRPLPTLLAAVAAGWLVGKLLR